MITLGFGGAGAGRAEAEWVVSGYLGAAHTSSSRLTLSQPASGTDVAFASIDYSDESFAPPLYYGCRVARFFSRPSWLGVEAEFIHLKVYARTDRVSEASGRVLGAPVSERVRVGDILDSLSISHGLNFAVFNVVARHAAGGAGSGGRVALLARFGLGPTIPHAESRIDGEFHEGYELGAVGLHASGAAEVRLVRGVAVLLEYKVTHTGQTVAVARGEVQGRFTSHHGVLGLAWHF